MAFTYKLIETALGVTPGKEGWVRKMRFLTNLNAVDCCQSTTNEKLYFPTNSCKLQKHLGSSKIRSLKSAQLGKIHALLQDVL